MANHLLAVLITQLLDRGILDSDDIAEMNRRLDEGGYHDEMTVLSGIVLSAMIDTPENRRAAIHVIPDGGNDSD